MNIYKAEKAIAKKLQNNKIICSSAITPIKKDQMISTASFDTSKFDFANAGLEDDDLYFHQSILVSTNWNKNDDIFLPSHVWAARQTPNHKPTNFNHQSTKIVGHIVGNYAVDEKYGLIDEDTAIDELPSKFHILTNSVIYKVWHSDAEYQEEVAQLIDDIESGEMCVSMEAMFPDFAYALMAEDGSVKVVTRNESTAFLSEHLRAYGGTGYYEDFKIGRAPKNIRFIGKGYTKNPANEGSITFSKDNLFSFNNISYAEKIKNEEKNGVLLDSEQISNGDLLMAETNNTKQIDEINAEKKELQKQVDNLKAELAKADIAKHEEKVNQLQEDNKVLSAKVESSEQDIENLTATLSEKEKELAEVVEAKESLEKELNQIKADAIFNSRIAKFEALGFDSEVAKKKAEIFASLNDDQFNEVIAQMKPVEDKKGKKKDKMDQSNCEADPVEDETNTTAATTDVDTLETDEEVASAAADVTEDEPEDKSVFSFASAAAKLINVKVEK